MTTFAMRYARALRPLLSVLGMGGGKVELDGDELLVTMGWGFRGRIPLADITGARDTRPIVFGWGVHGWAGRWAVIGSSLGVVRLSLVRPAPARVCGVPAHVRTLWVSLEDPDGLLAALRAPSRP